MPPADELVEFLRYRAEEMAAEPLRRSHRRRPSREGATGTASRWGASAAVRAALSRLSLPTQLSVHPLPAESGVAARLGLNRR